MLTEEQLADRLRVGLAHETAHIEPSPGLLEAVHAGLAVARPVRRRPARWRPVLAGAAGLVVTAAVALAAIVLIGGHRPAPSPAATHPPGQPTVPGRAPRSAVAAQVAIRFGAVAHYCNGSTGNLVVCRAGQQPVAPEAQRLVEIRVAARLATGRGSWYAWNLDAPGCPQAGDGGPTRSPVRAGSTLVFDTLVPPNCSGNLNALVVYVTAAANADRERSVIVGRTTARLP